MKNLIITSITASLALSMAACQSLPLEFDGNFGAKVVASDSNEATITYASEDRKLKTSEIKKLTRFCAETLDLNYGDVKVTVTDKNTARKEVSFPVNIPIGGGMEVTDVGSGRTMQANSTENISADYSREMDITTFKLACKKI